MKRYTEEERTLICKEVSSTPENLQAAFRRAAEKLGRTPEAINNYWYRTLVKKQKCFLTVSGQKNLINYKNTKMSNCNTSISIFNKILKWLKIK